MAVVQLTTGQLMLSIVGPTGPSGGPTGPTGGIGTGVTGPTGTNLLDIADVLSLIQPGDPDATAAFGRAIATGKAIMLRYNGGVPYVISSVQALPSNTTVFGFGTAPNITVGGSGALFTVTSATNVHISNLNCNGGSHGGAACDFSAASNCSVKDCNFASFGIGPRILSGSTDILISGGSITGSNPLHGVQIDGASTHNNTVTNVEFGSNTGFGIVLTGGAYKNSLLFNKTFSNGIELIGVTYQCWGNRIIGNHAEGTGDNGISITGFDNVVADNICRLNAHNGICVYGSGNTVTGNNCKNNGQRALVDSSSWAGIHVDPSFGGAGYHNTVTGNICADDQAVPTQAWGTRCAAADYTAWSAGLSVPSTTYVFNGTNVYVSASTGTTGATPPTWTTGTQSDGGVSWTFLFGLLAGNSFLGAAQNAVVGNICHGNTIADTIDQSGNSNTDVGGNHSQLRSTQNLTPISNFNGRGGDLIVRYGANTPWITTYTNSNGTSLATTNWHPLQPRVADATSARASVLGAGYEGAQYWDTTQIRLVLNAGASYSGVWLDALGRQDPVTGITAAGSVQGNATPLAYAHAVVSTVGAGQGVLLPPITFSGEEMTIYNDGANALNVYPASGAQINALAANVAFSLAAGTFKTFRSVAAAIWRA